MKQYVLTEEQFQSLLKELELEKFHTPSQFAITDEQRKAQRDAVNDIHRRFHYLVCRAIQG